MNRLTATLAGVLALAGPLAVPTAALAAPTLGAAPRTAAAPPAARTGPVAYPVRAADAADEDAPDTGAPDADAPDHRRTPRPGRDATRQWRGYWVDAFNPGIFTTGEVSRLVADARKAGANALIVQTARRFDCFCNQALYPRTDAAIAPAPYDPLAEIVTQAHAAGLQVHAWVNATTLWNSATPPTSAPHAFNRHGPGATGADRWLDKRVDGVEFTGNNSYVDPGNPAVVDYIADAVASIQAHYDIDGINLDYIRYPDDNSGEFVNDWGYTDVALARFRAETGRRDRPAPEDEQWAQWRRDQVSNLVRRVYVRMYEQDPGDRLSINGITYAYGPSYYGDFTGTRPYRNVLQDYRTWLREGYLDTVTAMNYKRNWMPDQAQMFTTWNDGLRSLATESGRYVVSGPALYLNSIADSVAQARAITGLGLGWSGYSYANASTEATASTDPAVKASQRDALATALTAQVFRGPAAVPAMPWKRSTGVLAGVVSVNGAPADQVSLSLTPLGSGHGDAAGAAVAGPDRRLTSDGSGWYAAASLAPGRYAVRITEPGATARSATAWIRVGRVTHLDLRATMGE